MNNEQKLQLIIDLLQQANKTLERALKLMELLAGNKLKKQSNK